MVPAIEGKKTCCETIKRDLPKISPFGAYSDTRYSIFFVSITCKINHT
jgi:hypothetical protein